MCSQPSIDRAEARVVVLVVAAKMFGPLSEQLAVVGDAHLDAGQQPADRAEAVLLDRRVRRHRRGLGHAVALEHRHAAAVEELEDLVRDRRRAGDRVLQAAAEDGADVLEQLLVGRVELRLQLRRHRLGRAATHVAHLHAELAAAFICAPASSAARP